MFPERFNIPVLIVQHMPAGFTKAFAGRLDSGSKLSVKEAEQGDIIRPGWAYVAPGGFHMVVKDGRVELNQEPPMHGVRPCADKLFISAAENMAGKVIGVVLTGMGRDGTQGLLTIGAHGGICIAEDESTCTIFGMPKSAIEKGAAHIVAPLDLIVPELLQIAGI
jgi:two-component system chemotaxis response regulator CheB